MIVQTNDANYVRDVGSNSIINTNVTAYKLFKQQRTNVQHAAELANEVNALRDQVNMLTKLIGQYVQNDSRNNPN